MDAIAEIAAATEDKAPESSGATTSPAPESTGLPEKPETPEEKARRLHAPLPEGTRTDARGRKSKVQKAVEEEILRQKTEEQRIEERAQEIADYKITGRQLADGFVYVNATFFGPEFQYFPPVRDAQGNIVKDEQAEFYKIGGDMAEQYGWRRLPPYIQIALVLTAYYGIRAAMPPVRQRFGSGFRKVFGWVGGKIAGFFRRKHKEAPLPAIPNPPAA